MAELTAKQRINLADKEINDILEKYQVGLDSNDDRKVELSDNHSRQFKVIN